MSDWQTCTGFPVVFPEGAAWCVKGAYFRCAAQFLAESWRDVNAAIRRGDLVPVIPPGAQQEKRQRVDTIKANKQRSETRAWLEAHGWRFMGFNPKHRTAYYANLNLNTVQTFPQWQAEEITRRVMFGVKVGQNMGLLFNQLGINDTGRLQYPCDTKPDARNVLFDRAIGRQA